MGATDRFSDFVVGLSYGDIPEEGVRVAKEAILDCLGCMLVGSRDRAGEIVSEYVRGIGAKPISTVIGRGFKSSPSLSALANGVMAHAIDYDDISSPMIGHPSVPLVPAIFAVGEMVKASGRDIITAYVCGFEVEARLGLALNPSHYDKGWHSTSTLGILGASASSSKLLGLEKDEVKMAFGIASSTASGLKRNFGTMTKPFHPGNAARGGVEASILARMGFSSAPDILEAPFGFLEVFSGKEAPDIDKALHKLGEEFEILKSGIAFKPYPSCGATHPIIEAVLNLKNKLGIKPGDVEEMEIVLNESMSSILIYREPRTGLEGKFSAEYCAALALVRDKITLKDFEDEGVRRGEIREVMGRIKRKHEPLPTFSAAVVVRLGDGREFREFVEKSKGWPENPMSWDELSSKYIDCASYALGEGEVRESLKMIEGLEELRDISILLDTVRGGDAF